jgi:hypothetical protein
MGDNPLRSDSTMPDTDEVETTEEELENNDESTDEETTAGDADETESGDDPLAKLKTALAAERKLRKDEERKRKTAEQALADKDKPAADLALEEARRDAEKTATQKANERIAKAELRAAAAKQVSNLNALVRLTDIDAIEVDDDGDPSEDDIASAIEKFLTDYPEFAADKSKFTGSADQGAKGKQTQKRQLTRDDIKSMTPQQILKAQEDGLLTDVLGGK